MPVIVEARLQPSRLQRLFDLLPLLCLLLLLLVLDYRLWLVIAAVGGGWLWWQITKSELDYRYWRCAGERVQLWPAEEHPQTFQWFGKGWRTPLFIRWTLVSEEGLVLQFYLWRDAVSEASWRAANMAFRVQGAVKKSTD